jgi:hypothetical protein
MSRLPRLLAALCLALAPLPALAQEFTLKLRQAAANEPVEAQRSDQLKVELKLSDAAGNAVQGRKEARTLTLVFRETGLDRAEGEWRFTSLQRDYRKAERHRDGGKDVLPYQGKTVVIDKKEGKYNFRIGDDLLDGKEAEELENEFRQSGRIGLNGDAWLPKNPVKVGAGWKIDVAPFTRDLARANNCILDEGRGSGAGKLLKVFEKDGRRFGELEANLEFVITHLLDPKNGIKTPCQEGRLLLRIHTIACIDGSREQSVTRVTLESDVRAEFSAGGVKHSLSVGVRATLEESRTGAP